MINPSNSPKPNHETKSAKFDRRVIFPIAVCILLALLGLEIKTFLPLFRPTAAPPPEPSSTHPAPKAVLLFPTDTPRPTATLTPTSTILPSPAQPIRHTETKTPIPFAIRLNTTETAPNQFNLTWKITGPAKTTASLRIGDEVIPIKRAEFNGVRTLTISAETEIELTAKSGESEKSQQLRLTYTERSPRILKFIVRIENAAGQAVEKIAELIPDPKKPDLYAVQIYRANPLPQGVRLQIEWEVADADTLTIEPLSQGLLAPAGASTFVAKESVNFNLTAISGAKRVDASIPIRIATPINNTTYTNTTTKTISRTPTPVRTKIDFFTANPTALTMPGATAIAWSVSGPANHIRLLDSAGGVIGENLPSSGLRSIPIASSQTLMLQVETDDGTLSAITSIRYKPETSVNLLPTELTLYDVFRNQPIYTVGDRLTFNAGFSNLRANHPLPTGSILVSDGVSACVISLPKDTCEMLLRADGTRDFKLVYSGDRSYLPSTTSIALAVKPFTREPVTLTLSTVQDKTIFHPGEKIRLNAALSSELATGTLFFSNSVQTCLVTLPKNTCELTALDPGTMTVHVRYSGDANYLDASAELEIINSPIEPTSTPVMIPTSLTILQLFPEKERYETGDSVEIYAQITNNSGTNTSYRTRIRVSDGVAECTFNPNIANHCVLKLVQAGATAITVSYPGDAFFSPSMASVPISVSGKPKITTQTKILSVTPDQTAYQLNETLTVTVDVKADSSAETNKKPTGAVTVQAGTESCLIMLPDVTSCTLRLSDPGTVELTASYAGDDTFVSSAADPRPLSLQQMAFALELYPVKFESCADPTIDRSEPLSPKNKIVDGVPLIVFYPDERFQIGRGLYLHAVVETFSNVFPNGISGGIFTAELCPETAPDHCATQTAASQPIPNDPNRQEALIAFPPLLYAGLYKLTLDFSANDPALGRHRSTAQIQQIMPGSVFLQPEGAILDIPSRMIHWENINASFDQDQSYTFLYQLILDQDHQCTTPLTTEYPEPAFESIAVHVADSVPGAGISDDAWRNAFSSQGISVDILDQLQPNRSSWLSDRCGLTAVNQVHAVVCRQVGLTEPSKLTPVYGILDSNYQISAEIGFPIDVTLSKTAAVILPSAVWESASDGTIYWLNAHGTDFNYWAAPNCDDPTERGFQTSSARIPEDRKLNFTAKLLSRARSTDLQLADADGLVTISPGGGSDWRMLPTYHGICGSCNPKIMMDFDWIANDGCESDGGSIRLTNPDGKLTYGQTCEYNPYAHVGIQSDFCQVMMGNAREFIFELEETDTHLSASTHLSTSSGRGVIAEPLFSPDSSIEIPADSAVDSDVSESFFAEPSSDAVIEVPESFDLLNELAAQLEETVEPTDLIIRERYGAAAFESFMIALPNNPPDETFIADANNSVRFLNRAFFEESWNFIFDIESQSESQRNCAVPPDGFTLGFEINLTTGITTVEFPCSSPNQFSEPLICETDFSASGIDPEEVLALLGIELRFDGDECFNEANLPLDIERQTVVSVVEIETVPMDDGFEVWLSDDEQRTNLTLYCYQPGVDLSCAGSCWGIDSPLPLEDPNTVFIPALNALLPDCYTVSIDRDGRVTLGVP